MTPDPAEHVFADLLAWARGDPRPPYRLFAYLTERCNLRCGSCGLATGDIVPGHDELDDATLLAVADQAVELGVRECYLTGGEVLVRKPVVLAFMERLAAAGVRGVLSTNGTTLDHADAGRIVAMGWQVVIVSLDGSEPGTNDPLRSRDGVFAEAAAMIRDLVGLRGDGVSPEVHVHTVVSRANADRLAAMVELCADLGADYFAAEPIVWQQNGCDDLMLDDRARACLAAEVPRAPRRAADLELSTNLGFLLDAAVSTAPTDTATINTADTAGLGDGFAATPCFVPFHNLVLHPNGVVAGCWQVRDDVSARVPDVTLADAWFDGEPARLREQLRGGGLPDHCRRCCLINARDNRRYRALLLSELGSLDEAREALRTALRAEPELTILRQAEDRLRDR